MNTGTTVGILVGGTVLIALILPIIMDGGRPQFGSTLDVAEFAFKTIFNNTGGQPQYNVTADTSADNLQFIAGEGMIIITDFANDRITFNSTGGAGDGDEDVQVKEGGATVGVPRHLNFDNSNDFTIAEDAGNNEIDITILRNSINGIAGLDGSGRIAKAQSPDTTVYEDESNTWSDGIKQTFNPSATNTGINVGAHTAEPSSPADGDIFYDSTANQFKFRESSAWNTLGGSATDIISEGNSNVEVIDLGSGRVEVDIDGSNEYFFNATHLTMNNNKLAGSMGCINGQILEYNSGTGEWECGTDDGAGGGGALDDIALEGSIIANARQVINFNDTSGLAGLNFNVVDESASNRGTVTATIQNDAIGDSQIASHTSTKITITNKGQLNSNTVYTDQANTYSDTFVQTFQDDDFQLNNPAATFQYIFSTNAIAADRTVTLPLLGGNDVFTMNAASQTLTNKGIDFATNTISGTAAEFDTAVSDDNIAYEGQSNTWSDGIKQTFNPSATNAGINVGAHTAEPSSPADGDIFYDSTANQFKFRQASAWETLGGGGTHNLLSATHPDTTAQVVSRGSLIVGIGVTPTWNELVIGGANTVLRSDGTDATWGQVADANIDATGITTRSKLPAAIVYDDEANTYADAVAQTHSDNDFQISNPAATFQYIFSTNAITADRTVTLPLLGGNDVFTMNAASQTLTNKGIDCDSNTCSNIEDADIKAGAAIAWSKVDKSGSILNDIGSPTSAYSVGSQRLTSLGTPTAATDVQQVNRLVLGTSLVISPCADTQILKYQISNTTWICSTDLSGGSGDIISEGDSNVEVIDAGTGQVDIDIDGANEFIFQTNLLNVLGATISNIAQLVFSTANQDITSSATGLTYDVDTGDNHNFDVNGVDELTIDASAINTHGNTIQIVNTDQTIQDNAGSLEIDVATTESISARVNNVAELIVSGSQIDNTDNTLINTDINCDGTGNSCINVDTPDIIGVADPRHIMLMCGDAYLYASNTAPKTTIDGTNHDYVVCDFDTTTAETIEFVFIAPDNFNAAANLDAQIYFQVASGTAGVCFDISFLDLASGGTVDGTFTAVQGGCDSSTGTNTLEVATISFTSAQHSIDAGDVVFVKLARDVADAGDTNTNDARFIALELRWN